jgi:hypothetical protein
VCGSGNPLKNTFTAQIILQHSKTSAMNTIEKKSVNAGESISKQQVDTLISAYKQDRWAANSERLGKADSLSVWYTVEELEAFLATVKDNGGNGVRFHFGVFNAENALQPEFEGRQTLVMIGNRSTDGTYASSKELYSNKNGKPEIVAHSAGVLCPPFCGGGGLGKASLIIREDNSMEII